MYVDDCVIRVKKSEIFYIYVIDWHKHRNYRILERYDFRNSIELLINEQLSVCAPGWHSYRL
jgi:hypothetical protein